MVNRIQLDNTHLLEDKNISEDNQSDKILSDFLPEQNLTASLLNMFLATLLKIIIVANTNKLICKVYIVNKQTQMMGHKPMTPTIKPLQKAYSNLQGLYDPASIRGNYYFIVIINNNTKKVWIYGVTTKDMFFLVFKIQKKGVKTAYRQIVKANTIVMR